MPAKWKVLPPPDSESKDSVYDAKSETEGIDQDGKPFTDC